MEQMNLTLAIKANNKGVTGTVRETAREVRGLQGSLSGTATAAQANARNMVGMTTAGQEANRMFRLQKGALQQAGYQFQDFFVQVGSGTSAFVALGQQGSQLLGILGPGGALLGAFLAIGSVVGGTVYSSVMSASGGVDALSDSMEYLDTVMERTESGAFRLTDRIRDLAKESMRAAEIEIRRGLVEAASAFDSARSGLLEVAEDKMDTTFLGDFEGAISQAARLSRLGRDVNEMFAEFGGSGAAVFREGLSMIKEESSNLSREFGITVESARSVIGALGRVQADPTAESLSALQQALFDANDSAKVVSPEFTRLASELGQIAQQGVDASVKGEALRRWAEDLGAELKTTNPELVQAREEIDSLIEKLRVQADTQGKSTLEMIEYNRQMDIAAARDAEAGAEKIELINTYYDQIYQHEQAAIATKKEEEAQRELTRAQREYEQSVISLVNELDPLGAEFESVYDKQQLLIEAAARGDISEVYRDTLIANLVEGLADAGDQGGSELAEKVEKQMSAAGQRVASSLQDAITSGDWDGIGASIGGALAGAIGGMVTDALAEQMAGQAAAGIFGPLAGAVAGGIAGLAVNKISDWLSGDDWDPTEDRQARQGTGTVLGDINAKSESIRRAVEASESGIGQLVGINQGMLQALQTLQLGIGGAVDMVARQRAGLEFSTSDRYSQGQLAAGGLGLGVGGITTGSFGPLFGAASGVYGAVDDALGGILTDGMEFLDNLTGGLLSDIGSSVFGGDQKVVDEGVRIIGGNLNDLVNKTLVQAYATIKEDGGWFSSDKRFDRFQDIATNQFSLVFESISDAVARGAEALGMGDEAAWVIDNYMVGTARISLEGLNAEEQRAEIEAWFGTIFDDLSGRAIPFLEDFQRAGEGLGETLARVANQTLVTQEAVSRLGVQFTDLTGEELVRASERLMEAAGGVEQFIASMEGFIDTFASDARQFELAQSDLSRALGQANLAMPATREGYYELLRAQNGATEAGAKNIATLLKLRDSADEYYTYLEDSQAEATRAQRELLGQQRSEVQAALREAEQASGAIANALGGMLPASAAFQQAERGRALDLLRGMARSGSVSYDDTFTGALSAATSISARDYGSMADYIRDVAATGAVLTDLQAITDEQVAVEERMLDSLDRQLDAVESGTQAIVSELTQIERTLSGASPAVATSSVPAVRVSGVSAPADGGEVRREIQLLRSELAESQRTLSRHAAKTAEILEYIEVYGIGVREQ